MAVLPPIKRFIQDDYQGVKTIQDFTGKLFYPLNLFLNAVYSALNNGLTINANSIGSVTIQAAITTSSTGTATTTINWPYPQSPPLGLMIINCSVSTVANTIPLYSWSYSSGVISVSMQFTKITAGAVVTDTEKTYSVTFYATGG